MKGTEERVELSERRLGDRIIFALELAVEQNELSVAEHLRRALEEAMTRFGGPGMTEKRDLPERMIAALEGLDALRRAQQSL